MTFTALRRGGVMKAITVKRQATRGTGAAWEEGGNSGISEVTHWVWILSRWMLGRAAPSPRRVHPGVKSFSFFADTRKVQGQPHNGHKAVFPTDPGLVPILVSQKRRVNRIAFHSHVQPPELRSSLLRAIGLPAPSARP